MRKGRQGVERLGLEFDPLEWRSISTTRFPYPLNTRRFTSAAGPGLINTFKENLKDR